MRAQDAADRYRLSREIQALRATIREHPRWDAERGRAERVLGRLEGRLSDVKARRPAEEWTALLASAPADASVRFPQMLEPLPAFDENSQCPKCGKGRALTRWVPDRLERTCRRCAYSWLESPLSAELPLDAKDRQLPG